MLVSFAQYERKKMPVKGLVYFSRVLMKMWPFSACCSFSLCPPCRQASTDNLQYERFAYFHCI
jgi:hypothetical protein